MICIAGLQLSSTVNTSNSLDGQSQSALTATGTGFMGYSGLACIIIWACRIINGSNHRFALWNPLMTLIPLFAQVLTY